MPERNKFLRGLRAWAGYRQKSLEYERDARYVTVRWGAEIHIGEADAARPWTASSHTPMCPFASRTVLGQVVSTLSFVLASVYFLQRLLADEFIPQGFTTLAILVLFLGGVQLLTIGLLGEYIGRIYDEVKRRPEFVERELIGFASSEDVP